MVPMSAPADATKTVIKGSNPAPNIMVIAASTEKGMNTVEPMSAATSSPAKPYACMREVSVEMTSTIFRLLFCYVLLLLYEILIYSIGFRRWMQSKTWMLRVRV